MQGKAGGPRASMQPPIPLQVAMVMATSTLWYWCLPVAYATGRKSQPTKTIWRKPAKTNNITHFPYLMQLEEDGEAEEGVAQTKGS